VPTVREVVQRLLPAGSGFAEPGDLSHCPVWPPDVFAVAATLVEASGCYSDPRYSGRVGAPGLFGKAYVRRVRAAARRWRRDVQPPPSVRKAWAAVVRCNDALSTGSASARVWQDAAIELLAVTDEACEGIGFHPPRDAYTFADFAVEAHRQYLATGTSRLPYVPGSLCVMVPPSEACVLPKTRTAQVGCTLRTMSHNLALLPARSRVVAQWHMSVSHERDSGALRLLLVPYPFRMRAEAFIPGARIEDESASAHFTIRQEWLRRIGSGPVVVDALVDFTRELMRDARKVVGAVNGVVFPEGSLDGWSARQIANRLAGTSGLEFFVAGVTSPPRRPAHSPRNQAYASLFFQKNLLQWWQSKHHRWCIDRSQIERYGLERVLKPNKWRWWEDIDISRREVHFYVFRPGASIAVLVCEDLARVDPVQPVVRAVGPTLVVALLLDGAQSERRWPARYATVLADDPGSAVLTLTSLGMVRRSMKPGESRPMPVALWKDSAGVAQELALPQGSHGLVLDLRCSREKNWTLDGRSDGGATVRLRLAGVAEVTHPNPPAWV